MEETIDETQDIYNKTNPEEVTKGKTDPHDTSVQNDVMYTTEAKKAYPVKLGRDPHEYDDSNPVLQAMARTFNKGYDDYEDVMSGAAYDRQTYNQGIGINTHDPDVDVSNEFGKSEHDKSFFSAADQSDEKAQREEGQTVVEQVATEAVESVSSAQKQEGSAASIIIILLWIASLVLAYIVARRNN